MPLIRLTDDTTTIELTDGDNHALREGGWAPAVSHLDEATLGGRGPYADVEEALRTDLFSSDSGATGLLQRLQGVSALLLQARRWAQGAHGVAPVRIEYQPDGSALDDPLVAPVYGRPGQGAVGLPTSLNDLAFVGEVEGAEVRFVRGGAWLGPEEVVGQAVVDPEVAPGVENPGPFTCTFSGALPYPSPTWVELINLPQALSGTRTWAGLFILSDRAGAVQIVEAEDGDGTNWADHADSGNGARGGSVKRFTAPVGLATGSLALPGIPIVDPLVQIWALVRNTDGEAADIRMRFAFGPTFTNQDDVWIGDWIAIPTDPTPAVMTLGVGSVPLWAASGTLEVIIDVRPTVAGQIVDIDYLVVTGMERVHVIRHDPMRVFTSDFVYRLRFDPRVLERPHGDVRLVHNAFADPNYATAVLVGARGSPAIYTSGETLTAVYLAPYSTRWRLPVNFSDVAALAIRAGRRPAYLIPE